MRLLSCLVLALLCSTVFAAAPPGKVPPKIFALIDQLGDEETREAAEKKLVAIDEWIIPVLRRASKSHADIDVRLRVLVAIAAIEKRLYGEVRRFTGSTEGVATLAISPDGKRLVSGCWDKLTERVARVWDLETGKELLQLKHSSAVLCVAWSPDGKQILAGGNDRSIRLFDAATGKELLAIPLSHSNFVHAVLFTADGKQGVSCGYEKTIVVWDLATGKPQRRIEHHTAVVRGLAWLPGGKFLASAGFDGTVRLIDFETGKEVRKMGNGHLPHHAWFVAASPDGKRLASTGDDKMIRLWDVESGRQIKEFAGHTEPVHGIAYSKCGQRLLSAGTDKTARVWDIASGKEIQSIEAPARVTCVAFSPDDGHALFSCYDRTLRLWRVRR